MSTKLKREIDCLKRLHDLTSQLDDILSFLKQEGLVDDNQIRSLKQNADHPKELQALLRNLQKSNKIQMLEYVWTILPVENISIDIITDRNRKLFEFNG
jgi:uncharacterized protein HemY